MMEEFISQSFLLFVIGIFIKEIETRGENIFLHGELHDYVTHLPIVKSKQLS